MKLNPYDPKAVCPKCGGKDVRTRYEGKIENDPCWFARKYDPPGKFPEHEYQHRTCSRCRYEWPEAVTP